MDSKEDKEQNLRLADWQIHDILDKVKMIDPYVGHQVSEVDGRKVVSYGLTSAGYDIRISDEFKIFSPIPGSGGAAVDPKNFDSRLLHDFKGEVCELPAHSYALAKSVESFNIPEDIQVTCVGKSTYARCGIYVNVTPLEPGWRGVLTVEIANASPSPVKIYANEGIAQLLFDQLKGPARVSYAAKKGKYQDQTGIVTARMKE